jgi:protein TilB
VPQLVFYNGNEILKSEKIKARQNKEKLEKELAQLAIDNVIKKEMDPDKENPNKYTKEYRRKLYKEMEEEKIKKEQEKTEKNKDNLWEDDYKKEMASVYKDNGEIRICNQGKYEFFIEEDIFKTGMLTFELKLPKYMETNKIKVDLNPQYVRIEAKDKVTQLRFDNEILIEKATIQRSQTTGHLLIKAPIAGIKPKLYDLSSQNNNNENVNKMNRLNDKKKEKKIFKPINDNLNVFNNIEVKQQLDSNLIKEVEKVKEIKEDEILDEVDLSEIPDLD